MSLLLLVVTSLFGTAHSSETTPIHTGDRAILQSVRMEGDKVIPVSRAVHELIGYDSVKRTYSVRITTTPTIGAQAIESQTVSASELAAQDEILNNCTAMSGTKQTQKVGSADLQTCRLSAGDPETDRPITVWFGVVPFGLVRSEMNISDKEKLVTTLESYRFGTGSPSVASSR